MSPQSRRRLSPEYPYMHTFLKAARKTMANGHATARHPKEVMPSFGPALPRPTKEFDAT